MGKIIQTYFKVFCKRLCRAGPYDKYLSGVKTHNKAPSGMPYTANQPNTDLDFWFTHKKMYSLPNIFVYKAYSKTDKIDKERKLA
jgi:hypothetical protein